MKPNPDSASPLSAPQIAALFIADSTTPSQQAATLQQIAADAKWLRAELSRVELSIDGLTQSVAALVDALAEIDDSDPEDSPVQLTLDGDDSGSHERDQSQPL